MVIFFEHAVQSFSFTCVFGICSLKSHLPTYHSNIDVWLRQVTKIGTSTLMRSHWMLRLLGLCHKWYHHDITNVHHTKPCCMRCFVCKTRCIMRLINANILSICHAVALLSLAWITYCHLPWSHIHSCIKHVEPSCYMWFCWFMTPSYMLQSNFEAFETWCGPHYYESHIWQLVKYLQ